MIKHQIINIASICCFNSKVLPYIWTVTVISKLLEVLYKIGLFTSGKHVRQLPIFTGMDAWESLLQGQTWNAQINEHTHTHTEQLQTMNHVVLWYRKTKEQEVLTSPFRTETLLLKRLGKNPPCLWARSL